MGKRTLDFMESYNDRVVSFTKKEIKKYLDECIRFWRKKRDEGDSIAEYYVDAFQSVRISIFGKLLEKE